MLKTSWQCEAPIDAIIFDCDGTLSAIEGIDELANMNHKGDIVQRLTAEAMGKTGMTLALYEERLAIVQPNFQQMQDVGQQYVQQQAPDVFTTIAALKRLNKAIYIVSAGLYPAVLVLGTFLEIPPENIFAVDIQFGADGRYLDFDRHSPMTRKNGKREIVEHIKQRHSRTAFIGDGLSDYEVYDLVTRFVGYGGAYYRPQIEKLCEFYIKTISMAPLLPLLLTMDEQAELMGPELVILQRGLHFIAEEKVSIQLTHNTQQQIHK